MRGLAKTSFLVSLVWAAVPSVSLSHEVTGQIVDARTGAGIDRLRVTLGDAADTTRGGGHFRVASSRGGRFVVDGGGEGLSVFLIEPLAVSGDADLTIPLIPLGPLNSGRYRNLLHMFTLMTGTGEPSRRAIEDVSISYESSPRTTILRRWNDLPIRIHVPPRQAQGFSWNGVFENAVRRWEDRTGLDLFERVEKPEDAQVKVLFAGGHSRVIFSRAAPGGIPLEAVLWLSTDLAKPEDLQSSAEHELGHILMLLVHSEDPEHVMYWGGSRGRSVSDDEGLLVRCLYGLPNLTDMSAYREEAPLTKSMIERKQVLTVVLLQCLVGLFVILASH